MKKILLCSLILASGCTSNLTGTREDNLELIEQNKTSITTYFTESAADEVLQVPVHYGFMPGGKNHLAIATTWIGSLVYGYGFNEMTIFNEYKRKSVSFDDFVHEGIHHAYNLGFIDGKEFISAWKRLEKDSKYPNIVPDINEIIKRNYSKGIQDDPDRLNAERIAWLSEDIVEGKNIPDYVLHVYRAVLKPILHP